MCGIAGFWNLDRDPVSETLLQRFTDTLAHRGPDGHGFHIDTDANLGLGHRRLAILDVTDTGRQPMSYAGGRYWITYNGEIYNFLEVRHELLQHGYNFQSESDTEVIMAAYDKWGEECQLRFNGMWAFAIWDRRERKLFVSRDRFGVKPLLYVHDGKHFAFASEMKAFLALDWFPAEFDPEMVSAALTNHKLIEGSERCLLRGLKRLPGGYCLTIEQGGMSTLRRWWSTLDHLPRVPDSYEEQVEQYRDLFLDACRIRMRSDVPIGTALSGGLDSSSIVCAMHHIRQAQPVGARLATDWQRAFVATYPGNVVDERAYADFVVQETGADAILCEITPAMYLENYESVLFQFEEIADIHLGPWVVHKRQRESGVVVTIDGHGGDEALGGYPWHVTAALADAVRALGGNRAAQLLGTLKGLELFPPDQFYVRSLHRALKKTKQSILGSASARWLQCRPAEFQSPGYEQDRPRLGSRDRLFRRLYADFHFTELPMNLRDFDRLSMAHGVEVRSPLMDWRLATYAFSLPSQAKVGGGYTKRILRDALKGILPEPVRLRTRKLGFPNMPEAWSSVQAKEFMRDSVASAEFQQSPIWDGRAILQTLRVLQQTADGDNSHTVRPFVQAMYLMRAFRERRRAYE